MSQLIVASTVTAIAATGLFFTFSPASPGTDMRRVRARGIGLLSIAGFVTIVGVSLAGAL